MPKTFAQQLAADIQIHAGVTLVQELDEQRLERVVRETAQQRDYNFMYWSPTKGLRYDGDDEKILSAFEEMEKDPMQAPSGWVKPAHILSAVSSAEHPWQFGPTVILAYDMVSWINHVDRGAPNTDRLLKDVVVRQKQLNETERDEELDDEGMTGTENALVHLVLCDKEAPQTPLGMSQLSLALPDQNSRKELVSAFLARRGDGSVLDTLAVADACAGLGEHHIERILETAFALYGEVRTSYITEQKKLILQARGITYMTPKGGFGRLGGLEPLKQWLQTRALAYDPELAADYDVQAPRGVILAGRPGGGKSAMANALAKEWGDVPLLHVDVGLTRGKFHGESEGWFRHALDTIDVIAPEGTRAVVWFDEVEKAFAGALGSGDLDSGVGSRVLGIFLTWLQERKSGAFVVATANQPETLPPELTRAGRIDGSFWIGLPTSNERHAILSIYRDQYKRASGVDLDVLTERSDGHTGAEIEAAFREAAYMALSRRAARITTPDIVLQLERLPKVADTYRMSSALSRWRDTALRANGAESTAATAAPSLVHPGSVKLDLN